MPGNLRLRYLVDLVHDKNLPASWRKILDNIDQHVKVLMRFQAIFVAGGIGGAIGKVGYRLDQCAAAFFDTIPVDRKVSGNAAQESKRGVHRGLRRLFQQLHADILHHVARKPLVAEAAAQMIDQFIVVMNQCGNQPWRRIALQEGYLADDVKNFEIINDNHYYIDISVFRCSEKDDLL